MNELTFGTPLPITPGSPLLHPAPKETALNLKKYNTTPVFWCNSNILILMIPATTYCRVRLIVMILMVFQTSPNFFLCISNMKRQSLTEKSSTLFIHVIFCTPKTEFCLNKLKSVPMIRIFQALFKNHQLVSVNFPAMNNGNNRICRRNCCSRIQKPNKDILEKGRKT